MHRQLVMILGLVLLPAAPAHGQDASFARGDSSVTQAEALARVMRAGAASAATSRVDDGISGLDSADRQPRRAATRLSMISGLAGGSRARHTGIGAAIGAVAGVIVYAVDQHQCTSRNGIPCGLGAGAELTITVGGGALLGALVGAMLPHDR